MYGDDAGPERHRDLRFHLTEEGVDSDLRDLICEIATASKYVVNAINTGDLGIAGTSNIYGEDQLALDVLSDRIIRRRLENSGIVKNIISEESGEIIACYKPQIGKYSVAYDPLDGSSLIDVNLAVGTIVSIMEGEELLRPGRDQVAAFFIVYGPRTTLVYTTGKGVHEFTMNHLGEYILSRTNITMADKASLYSPGGLRKDYSEGHEKFISWLEETGTKLRYSGGLVPDINQILLKGKGVFTYPALKNAPNGKLRLLFELSPMSYIVEQAGGKASTGTERLLDIAPTGLDQRAPIYIGCKEDVERAEEFLKG